VAARLAPGVLPPYDDALLHASFIVPRLVLQKHRGLELSSRAARHAGSQFR
jgi:hypothetical protein